MEKSFLKSRTIYFLVIIQLAILLFLFWNSKEDFRQFKEYHQNLSKHSSQSVASEIEILLVNLRRGLQILVSENPRLIVGLAEDPTNETLLSEIYYKLSDYFPHFHAVTVTDQTGEPFIDDFGEKIGDFCREDIKLFAQKNPQYGVSIHPGPAEYHFDIMLPWQIQGEQYVIQNGVFFVSFSLETLANILNDGEIPGHNIYLLHKDKKNLIEMTTQGSRDVLDGNNFIDDATEARISHREMISGTLWEVVDFPSDELMENYLQYLIKNNFKVIASLLIFMVIMFSMILREERRRKTAESDVLRINQNLEQLITERTKELQKFYSAIEQTADATVITDEKGVIEYVNQAFVDVTGYSHDEIIGKTNNVLKSGKHDKEFYQNMWQKLLAGESFHSIFTNRRKDGSFFHEEKTITTIKDDNDQISHYVGTGKDVTERIKHEKELSYLAHHDLLTGLPNRVLLQDRIEHSILLAQRSKNKLALMYLDLDRFKSVNDRLGHKFGDELLQQVSKRLTDLLRKSDTLCRSGGDEFIILLEGIVNYEDIGMLAQKVVQEMGKAFMLDDHDVNIGVSIGVAIYPDNGASHTELIRNADLAMYLAKEKNTIGYEFYSDTMSEKMIEKVELEAKLHHALTKNEFHLVYQPKVNLHSGETVGFETLLRWQDPELGFISPAKFIPILEFSGLIHEVGDWTIREVIKQVKQGSFQGRMVSINLSPMQFRNVNFIETVKRELQNNQILGSEIEFEVTESLLIDDFEQSKIKLQELSNMGCSIALDDFGTGFSSLSYLNQLPIDVLKVDRSFITNIHQYPKQQAMLESIFFMTKKLQISVVIEGVETLDELKEINQLGGSIIQGYYFSKPLMGEEIAPWLAKPMAVDLVNG